MNESNNNSELVNENNDNSQSSSSSSLYVDALRSSTSYAHSSSYKRNQQKTQQALSLHDFSELGNQVQKIDPIVRHGSAVLIDQALRENGDPGKTLSSVGQTYTNNKKYIESPIITQGNTKEARVESQARLQEISQDIGRIGGGVLFDEFAHDVSSTQTRSSFNRFKKNSQERGKQAEAEIQSKMIEIERDLNAADKLFVNEMKQQIDLSYGQKKTIISEHLTRGRLSSATKRAIRKESATRAQARQRDKTRLFNGRPSSKGNFQTQSVGKAPTSQPTYLKSNVSSNSRGRLKMPFSKFLSSKNSSYSGPSSLKYCTNIKSVDECQIQQRLSYYEALEEFQSNQFRSRQQETGFVQIEEHRNYENFYPPSSGPLPESAGPVELLYCATFIWVQGSKKVFKIKKVLKIRSKFSIFKSTFEVLTSNEQIWGLL